MWKDIVGYEGLYMVSDKGNVLSYEKYGSDGRLLLKRLLKGGRYSNGYKFVCLRNNSNNRNLMIHRLVAEAFIPNPNNKPNVNHIDGNKQNNNVENLEWCTQSENIKHAINIGLRKSHCNIERKVKIENLSSNKVIEFKTMKDCCDYFGFTKCWLGNYIRKNGNPCIYKKWSIYVSERVVV